MTYEPDFTDQLETYRAKMRQENDPVWQVGIQAYQQKLKADAVRLAIADLEAARWQFSQVLVPFLPEPAKPEPVALHGVPAGHSEGHHAYHADAGLAEDEFDPPLFMGVRA